MDISDTTKWKVENHFVFNYIAYGEKRQVSAEDFWNSRISDFISAIGLSIEGFGNLSLKVDMISRKLILVVESQSKRIEILDSENIPIDHIVIDDSWVPLLKDEIIGYTQFLREESLKLGEVVKLPAYLKLIAGKNQNLVNVFIDNSIDFTSEISLPAEQASGLAISPYPYQSSGINWLCALRSSGVGAILGDEMGLGKTVQLLGLIDFELKSNENPRILIIVPSSLKLNWITEFSKFLPNVSPYVHAGHNRNFIPSIIASHKVVVTTYPIVNRDNGLLSKINWTLVICDEAHVMKNPKSVTRQSVRSLSKAPIFLSTGTPLENNLIDLWSLTDLIRPGLMGPLNLMQELVQNQLPEAEKVGHMVRPLILRRLVKNVLPELPELVEKVHWIEPSFEFVREYENVKKEAAMQNLGNSNFGIITKLRRFCTYPPLVGDYLLNTPDAKVDMLLDLVDRIQSQNEKVIIFTSWHDSADFLLRVIQQSYPGIYCAVIDGREDSDERFPRITQFQSIEGFAVLICNTRAAGEGLNIVAANHIVHFDRQWNPAKESQATSRAHRIGQKKSVFVHKLVYSGTIEEVIDDRLLLKAYLAQEALNPAVEEEDKKSIAEALGVKPNYVDNGV